MKDLKLETTVLYKTDPGPEREMYSRFYPPK